MIGTAAARHLAEQGVSVAIMGAPEPDTGEDWDGPFASHWDEGRITRITDSDPTWSIMAARSISRYPDIANRSGIDFHNPVGLAYIAPSTTAADAIGASNGGQIEQIGSEELYRRCGIRPHSPDLDVSFEAGPAGLINPRRLVAAQVALAVHASAVEVTEPVTTLERVGTHWKLHTRSAEVTASRVLIATGAYGAELAGIELHLQRRLRTIVRAELSEGPALPTLITIPTGHDELDEMYWVPPVSYPNGRTLLKIGGNSLPMHCATDNTKIGDWFRSGASVDEAEVLREVLQAHLPDRSITWSDHQPCVVTQTATGRPYLGEVDSELFVAVGGSGSAAKSSDEIGRLAAASVLDTWADTDPAIEEFAPVFL